MKRKNPLDRARETTQIAVALAATESLWNDEETARYLGVSPKSLPRWRCEGRSPPFVKLSHGRSGLIRYRPADVIAWVARQVRTSTSDPGEAE